MIYQWLETVNQYISFWFVLELVCVDQPKVTTELEYRIQQFIVCHELYIDCMPIDVRFHYYCFTKEFSVEQKHMELKECKRMTRPCNHRGCAVKHPGKRLVCISL
jgi:hypothetical protein